MANKFVVYYVCLTSPQTYGGFDHQCIYVQFIYYIHARMGNKIETGCDKINLIPPKMVILIDDYRLDDISIYTSLTKLHFYVNIST